MARAFFGCLRNLNYMDIRENYVSGSIELHGEELDIVDRLLNNSKTLHSLSEALQHKGLVYGLVVEVRDKVPGKKTYTVEFLDPVTRLRQGFLYRPQLTEGSYTDIEVGCVLKMLVDGMETRKIEILGWRDPQQYIKK